MPLKPFLLHPFLHDDPIIRPRPMLIVLVAEKFGPYGLHDYRVTALNGKDAQGNNWPYVCQCVLLFESMEKWGEAGKAEGGPIFGDIPNFSKKRE